MRWAGWRWVLVSAVVFSAVPAGADAAQRYASPTGDGVACTSGAPCGITNAVNLATGGDEVIVTPGTYTGGVDLHPPSGVSLHGVVGQPRPMILGRLTVISTTPVSVADLSFDGPTAGLYPTPLNITGPSGTFIDRVLSIGLSGAACKIFGGVTVRDTACVTGNGRGMTAQNIGAQPQTLTLRNDTIVAGESGQTTDWGLFISQDESAITTAKLTVDVKNSIVRGPDIYDIFCNGTSSTAVTLTVSYSNFGTLFGGSQGGTPAAGTCIDGGHNEIAPPFLADPAHGDFHETADSPTQNVGSFDATLDGSLDLDGDLRHNGGTVDIGADQRTPAPTVSTEPVTDIEMVSAMAHGTLGPQGGVNSAHFEYGKSTTYGSRTPDQSIPASSGPTGLSAPLDGLTPGTTYHVRLVGTNATGTTNGQDVVFTTTSPSSPSAPETNLDSHPKAKLKAKKKTKVRFAFSSPQSGATFQCKLDNSDFAPCSSSRSYKVKPGKHTFAVEAVAAGVTDPTPATFSFNVKKKHRGGGRH